MARKTEAAGAPPEGAHVPPQAAEQAPGHVPPHAAEHAEARDPDARWRMFLRECASRQHELKPWAHVASAPPQGGAAGGSLGPIELWPLETLETRLVEMGGGPRGYIVRTDRVQGGFGPQGFYAFLGVAVPRPKPVPAPPPPPTDPTVAALIEQNRQLLDRLAQLEARAAAPPASPVAQATDYLGLVQNAFAMTRNFLSEAPKAAASVDAQTHEELGRLRALAEVQRSASWLEIAAAIVPHLKETGERLAGAVGDIAAARRAEAEAMRLAASIDQARAVVQAQAIVHATEADAQDAAPAATVVEERS